MNDLMARTQETMDIQGALGRLQALLDSGNVDAAEAVAQDFLDRIRFDPDATLEIVKQFEDGFRFQACMRLLERALDSRPTHETLLLKAGDISKKTGQTEDATYFLELAFHHNPASSAAYFLSDSLASGGETESALRVAEQAIQAGARDAQLLLHYSRLLKSRQRYHEAIKVLRGILLEQPDDVHCRAELAIVLAISQHNLEAIEIFESLKNNLNPVLADMAIASAYFQIGDFDRARKIYEACLNTRPHHFHSRFNRSMLKLLHGEFQSAWDDYYYRFHTDSVSQRLLPFRRWDGQSLQNETLLIYGEQGLGDEIMFASCFNDAISLVGHCVIECEPRLASLFGRSFPSATIVTTAKQELIPDWLESAEPIDYQIPAGTLPGFFRRGWHAFPDHCGYLKADPERVEFWRSTLAGLGPGKKIGLSWRGGTIKTRTGARTIALDLWAPLFDQLKECVFVSLQYGKETKSELESLSSKYPRIHHFEGVIADYDETAALVSALDAVVTVCTSIVHLSGALGKKTIVLVPTAPEWRYLRSGSRMPWYPSVELIRQKEIGDWSQPLFLAGDKICTIG